MQTGLGKLPGAKEKKGSRRGRLDFTQGSATWNLERKRHRKIPPWQPHEEWQSVG